MIQKPTDTPPPSFENSKEELSAAAKEINSAADELCAPIRAVEEYLDSLNIHVPAWVRVKGWEAPGASYWYRELGYDYIDDGWHLAIRETQGNYNWPEDDRVRTWAFNKSPRKSRISAVDKLPELTRDLAKEANKTARRLREKATEVAVFASSLKPAKATKQ